MRSDDSGSAWVKAVRPKGGMLIGAFPEAHFAQSTFRLAPGEGLFFYTDGLTEARTAQGTMLGEDGLTGFLHQRTGPPDRHRPGGRRRRATGVADRGGR
ncbi:MULTISPECIES: serine/threonine-protein phosphatase [unclassified Streptomyces]|uniref:serine/threonine-protein phosphatase n=1 Tax=Streptomyces sp. 135 TaxID=2838850 RepID=UPI0021D9539D|nr:MULTISPECIES: serine/threonine-protein phosphatase [unclassified Streptomyces]WPO73143.1 serine/threonine-protein phosphatase [Streptomyces sp. KN37]